MGWLALSLLDQAAPLGEITLAILRDSRQDGGRSAALAEAERRFGERQDYRLWGFTEKFARFKTYQEEIEQSLLWVEDGLAATDVIAWGVLAVTPSLLTDGVYQIPGAQRQHLVSLLDAGSQNKLDVIPGCAAECGIIRVLARATVDRAQHKDSVSRGVSPARGPDVWSSMARRLDDLEDALSEIDSRWKPGGAVFMEVFKGADLRRIAPWDKVELGRRIVFAIRGVQRSTRRSVTTLTPESQHLLDRAFLLARSAWQTSHFDRRGESSRIATRGTKSSQPFDRLKPELKALFEASEAAKDAGQVLLSAGLAHLLLRLIPDGLIEEPFFKTVGDRLCIWIRQAGLEVDSRFRRDRDVNRQEATDFMHGPNARTWPESRAVRSRIARDQSNGLWGDILTRYGPGGGNLRCVLDDAEKKGLSDDSLLRNAFSLYLRYGWIQEAYSVLNLPQYTPTRLDLVNFAHTVKRAIQVMPFGFNAQVLSDWNAVLRRRWSVVARTDESEIEEALVIHEVLLGRASAVVMNAGASGEGARLFARRYYGQLTDEQMRTIFDSSPEARRQGPATATLSTVRGFLKSVESPSLGVPVFISVADCGDSFGILSVGPDRSEYVHDCRPNGKTPLDLRISASLLKDSSVTWLAYGALGVPWGLDLESLATAIVASARKVRPPVKWIMLTIDPEFAGLPWQHLFTRLSGNEVLVSVIPSISSMTFHASQMRQGALAKAEVSDALELQPLGAQVLADEVLWKKRGHSIACILGHGEWSGELTTVRVSERSLKLDDWLEIATRSVAVVHSCFGGMVAERFSGDLGGLPGVALAMGCKAFCSPVTSVPVETASVLQRHLFQDSGPADLGSRYLGAIGEDERVSLYNVYGLANEIVTVAGGPVGMEVDA